MMPTVESLSTVLGKNLYQCNFVHHKSDVDASAIRPLSPRLFLSQYVKKIIILKITQIILPKVP